MLCSAVLLGARTLFGGRAVFVRFWVVWGELLDMREVTVRRFFVLGGMLGEDDVLGTRPVRWIWGL